VTSVGDSDPSNAELGRRLDALGKVVSDGFRQVAVDFEAERQRHDKYVLVAVHNVEMAAVRKDVADVRDELDELQIARRFNITTVLSALALIIAAIGAVVALVK
jgi:hypothetical protein